VTKTILDLPTIKISINCSMETARIITKEMIRCMHIQCQILKSVSQMKVNIANVLKKQWTKIIRVNLNLRTMILEVVKKINPFKKMILLLIKERAKISLTISVIIHTTEIITIPIQLKCSIT
jgi:hypothetical protein